MLEGVVLEELFIELAADLREDDFFGIRGMLDGYALFGKPCSHFLGSVEVEREVPVAPLCEGEDSVIKRAPGSELGEVVADARGVGAKVVGAVGVYEDPGVVIPVEGVATEVGAAINYEGGGPKLCGGAFGKGQAEKPVPTIRKSKYVYEPEEITMRN